MDPEVTFDLFITCMPQRELSVKDRRVWQTGPQPGFARLALPLEVCRRLLIGLRNAHGNGLVVPVQYREAPIDAGTAREIALRELEIVRSAGDELAPLEEAQDEGAWWTFAAPNLAEQAKGRIPGVRYISIDKLDGHVVNAEERSQLIKLSL